VLQGRVSLEAGRSAELWVDTAYTTEMAVETVAFASDRYFELAADPAMAEIMAISPELLVVIGDSAIRITSTGKETAAYPAPSPQALEPEDATPDRTDDLGSENAWNEFMRWLFGR